jgi:hypothetical protein
MKSLKATKIEERNAKLKVEETFNNGFKEYTYKEALVKAKLIPLAGGNVVDSEEIKKNMSDILDAMVSGLVEEARLHIRVDGNIDFAMKVKGQNKVADLRLGNVSEHIKSKTT